MINVAMLNGSDVKDDIIYLQGFVVEGHANYESYGKDIVCAAVSTISQSAIIGFDYIKVDYIADKRDGYLCCMIDPARYRDLGVQTILKIMELSIISVIEDYKDYVKIEYREML